MPPAVPRNHFPELKKGFRGAPVWLQLAHVSQGEMRHTPNAARLVYQAC